MFNKRQFLKANTKKVLHKVRKQWVVVSLALLMMIGGGAVATHVTHADANVNNQNNSQKLVNTPQQLQSNSKVNENNSLNGNNQQRTNNIQYKANELHSRLYKNVLYSNKNNKLMRLGGSSSLGDSPENNSDNYTSLSTYIRYYYDSNNDILYLKAKPNPSSSGSYYDLSFTSTSFPYVIRQHTKSIIEFGNTSGNNTYSSWASSGYGYSNERGIFQNFHNLSSIKDMPLNSKYNMRFSISKSSTGDPYNLTFIPVSNNFNLAFRDPAKSYDTNILSTLSDLGLNASFNNFNKNITGFTIDDNKHFSLGNKVNLNDFYSSNIFKNCKPSDITLEGIPISGTNVLFSLSNHDTNLELEPNHPDQAFNLNNISSSLLSNEFTNLGISNAMSRIKKIIINNGSQDITDMRNAFSKMTNSNLEIKWFNNNKISINGIPLKYSKPVDYMINWEKSHLKVNVTKNNAGISSVYVSIGDYLGLNNVNKISTKNLKHLNIIINQQSHTVSNVQPQNKDSWHPKVTYISQPTITIGDGNILNYSGNTIRYSISPSDVLTLTNLKDSVSLPNLSTAISSNGISTDHINTVNINSHIPQDINSPAFYNLKSLRHIIYDNQTDNIDNISNNINYPKYTLTDNNHTLDVSDGDLLDPLSALINANANYVVNSTNHKSITPSDLDNVTTLNINNVKIPPYNFNSPKFGNISGVKTINITNLESTDNHTPIQNINNLFENDWGLQNLDVSSTSNINPNAKASDTFNSDRNLDRIKFDSNSESFINAISQSNWAIVEELQHVINHPNTYYLQTLGNTNKNIDKTASDSYIEFLIPYVSGNGSEVYVPLRIMLNKSDSSLPFTSSDVSPSSVTSSNALKLRPYEISTLKGSLNNYLDGIHYINRSQDGKYSIKLFIQPNKNGQYTLYSGNLIVKTHNNDNKRIIALPYVKYVPFKPIPRVYHSSIPTAYYLPASGQDVYKMPVQAKQTRRHVTRHHHGQHKVVRRHHRK